MQHAGLWYETGGVAAASIVVAVTGGGDSDHMAWNAGDDRGEGYRDAEEKLWEMHCYRSVFGIVRGI